MAETSAKPVVNPDDVFSTIGIVKKYQRDFAAHFLPKHCIGVVLVQQIGENIRVQARLTMLAKISARLRDDNFFLIPVKDVEDWRKNLKLHTFMAGGVR